MIKSIIALSKLTAWVDLIHLAWIDLWTHRKWYSVYGPQHIQYAIKRADILRRMNHVQ